MENEKRQERERTPKEKFRDRLGTAAIVIVFLIFLGTIIYISAVGSVNQYGVRCKGFNDNAFTYFSPEDGTRITVEPGTHEYPLRDSGQTIYVRTFYDSCGCQTAKPFYLESVKTGYGLTIR